jgi:putative flippase GtrA
MTVTELAVLPMSNNRRFPPALVRTLHPRNRNAGRKLRWLTYFTFLASGIAGWFANTAALVVAVEVLLLPVWLSKLLAVMASFIVNFSMSHFVVFRVRRSLPATT